MRRKSLLLFWYLMVAAPPSGAAQETTIGVFSDVTFAAADKGVGTSFGLGQYSVFINSRISDRVIFLGEVVFEYHSAWVVDVERIVLTYEAHQYALISVGTAHTGLGYWNTAYHHGAMLQPTIQRPTLFVFEDEGGVLPIHNTGIKVHGDFITSARFGYSVMIGNGIGSTPTSDNDDFKSITLGLKVRPAEGLLLTVSAYFDRVSAGVGTFNGDVLATDMTQQILGAALVYRRQGLELISEVHRISNKPVGGNTTATPAFYGYVGYEMGNLIPYLRYDWIDFAAGDPYFAPNDNSSVIFGVRYNIDFGANVKFEYRRTNSDVAGAGNQFVGQFGVGF